MADDLFQRQAQFTDSDTITGDHVASTVAGMAHFAGTGPLGAAKSGCRFPLTRTRIEHRLSTAAQIQRYLIKRMRWTELVIYRKIVAGVDTSSDYIDHLVERTQYDEIGRAEQMLTSVVADGLSNYIERHGLPPRIRKPRPEQRREKWG